MPLSSVDHMVTLYQGNFDRRAAQAALGVRIVTWQNNRDLMRQLMIGGYTSILAPYLEARTTTGHPGQWRVSILCEYVHSLLI